MKGKRVRKLVVLGAAVGLVGSLVLATPAFAASASCSSPHPYVQCTTGSVAAHPYGHYIHLVVNAPCRADYRVYDISNNVTVWSGTASIDQHIGGLYGTYQATGHSEAAGCTATFTISNDWAPLTAS